MLGTTGVLLAALAVVCVMLEATWACSGVRRGGYVDYKSRGAAVRDGPEVAVRHTCAKKAGPLLVTGPYFSRSRQTDFKNQGLKPPPLPGLELPRAKSHKSRTATRQGWLGTR